MDEGLHFEITGENESLKSVVQESERLMDDLGEKAEETGEKLKHIFESGSVMTEGSIKDMFKDFSLDEYVQEIDAFVAAGGDAANQAKVLDMALRSVQSALDAAPVDNTALVDELNGIVENIKAAKGALEAQVMKEAEAAGMNFSFSAGNSDILSQEEIEELERARNATKELAEAEQEYQDVVQQRSQLPQPPTGGGSDGDGGNGGDGNPPSNPPSTPTDNRSIKDIENEIESLDKTIDKVTSKQGEITAMFDSYRGADAAAMSIRGLNQANDEIGDGFAELGRAQDAYNTKIADLEALAQKQEQALQNIKTAQEQAFANGDSRGAAKALADYSALSGQLEQTRQRIEQTKEQAANLGAVIDNNADVQNRYNDVLDAAEFADATNDIGALQEAFDSEKNIMEDCEQEMNRMQEELEELQEQMASGKLTPDEQGAAQKKLDDLRNKIAEVASAYQNASDRAKQFGGKIGQTAIKLDTGDAEKSGEKVNDTFGKLGNTTKNTSTQLGQLRMNVTSITRGFSAMSKGGAGVVSGLAGVGKGVLGLIGQVGMLNVALLKLLANPIVLLIAAIVAAIATLYKMVTKFINGTSEGKDMFATWIGYIKGFKEWIGQFVMEVSRKGAELVKNIGTIFKLIGASFNLAFTFVRSWGEEIFGFFGALFSGLFDYVKNVFKNVGVAIRNGWKKIKNFFGANEEMEDYLDASAAFDNVNKKIKNFGKNARDEVSSVRDYMNSLWNDLGKGFSSFKMPSLWEFMTTFAEIERLQRQITKGQIAWTRESAKFEAQEAELRNRLDRSGEIDKLQVLSQLRDSINKKYDKELSIARKELAIQNKIVKLKGSNVDDEDLKKQAELQAKVLNLENKRDQEVRSLNNQYADLTRQLKEQQREQQRILDNNAREKEISALQQKLKYEKDVTKQLLLQDQIRKKQLEKEMVDLDKQQQAEIESKVGKSQADLFANGHSLEEISNFKIFGIETITPEAKAELERIFAYYDKLREDAIAKSEQEGTFADYDADYQAYMDYCEEVIAAEEWKQQELAKIASGESNMTEAQVNLVYNNQIEQAGKNANLDFAELKLTDIAAAFQAKIAGATVEGIEEAYNELETAISGENNLIDKILGMSDGDKAERMANLTMQLGADKEIAQDENQDPNARAEAEERILEAQREILLLSYDQQQLDGQKIKNTEVLERMRKKATAAEQQGNKVVSSTTVKNMRNMKAMAGALGAVADMADMVANTFGGAMSKKAKKALGVISDVAKTGTSVISGIENLVNVATKGMTVTAASGVASMSALEKASFILTILSVAVQAITAIAQFLMKFTAAAKMQEQIDEHLDRVKQLEYEHDKLERQYQNSTGTAYYKNMSKAAKDYDNIIREQNAALAEANKLYEYQASKYGEDSGKAQDAKEQAQEIEKQKAEYEDAQRELYQTMMEDLSGTSLKTFSENLADALVDGFKQGKDEVNDVWDDMMDDLMRTMMKNQLALAIEDMFKPVFDDLNNATKNGELTQAEIDLIMSEFEQKSEQAKYLAEQYYNMMSERGLLDDDVDAEGSQGFGQMTQDQADTLTARFTALQMEGANVVAIAQLMYEGMLEQQGVAERQTSLLQSIDQYQQLVFMQAQDHLDQLQIIADNTALLSETNTRLKAIEQNTDKL